MIMTGKENRFPRYGKILPCSDYITSYYVYTWETLEDKEGYREALLGNEANVDSPLKTLLKIYTFSPMLIISVIIIFF